MEIKILCACGAKFKFDVDPVDDRTPAAVHCPVCGKDDTEETNVAIREQISGATPPVPAAPAIPRISVSAIAAPAATPTAASSPDDGAPKVAIPAIRIPAASVAPAAQSAATPTPIPVPAPAPAVGPKMTVMPVPETTRALSVKPPGESTSHEPAPAPAPNVSAEPKAPGSPKMAYMPVPGSTKALSVKPPGEATVHEAPPSAVPANASGDPTAPGSPKMAFMAAPAAGSGKALSVAGGHGKKDEQPAQAVAATAPEAARSHPAAAKMVKAAPGSGGIRRRAGYAGAAIGALLGMAIWYFIVISTGREVKWLAILVGICTGWGARLLGGGKDGKLSTAAGWSAIAAILLGQFLAIQHMKGEIVDEVVEETYKERIALAKDAAAANTDKDVRAVMIKDEKGQFAGKAPDSISDDDLAKYRLKEFAALQKFASGSPSRTQYEAQIRKEIEESGAAAYEFRFVTLIWIAAGVTAAWKIVKPPETN